MMGWGFSSRSSQCAHTPFFPIPKSDNTSFLGIEECCVAIRIILYTYYTHLRVFFFSFQKKMTITVAFLIVTKIPSLLNAVSEMAPSFFNRISKSPVYYKLP